MKRVRTTREIAGDTTGEASDKATGLSEQTRGKLAELVRRQRGAPDVRVAPAAPAVRESYARWLNFTTLPGFEEMEIQRAMATAIGLENPYFREHAVRAGAVTMIGGADLDNFSSYDYLGLNGHPRVAAAATAALERYGTSVSASRLVSGERPVHKELESALAAHYGAEAALAFVSGHATNVGTISTLLGKRDLVVHDALAHNSIVMGATLSRAERRAYPHNDLAALDDMLSRLRPHYERTLIVVEGLYSMDGDYPDLEQLVAIKRRHCAWLMVDEAHALGVVGETGHGLFERFGVDPREVDIWMGTLSKTLAACGGYIAGSEAMVSFLKHAAGSFVYSVGLSAPLAAAALEALKLLHEEPERVACLQANGALFLEEARKAGLDTGPSLGLAVVPVVVGDSLIAVALSQRLRRRGVNVQPIIHPAVTERASRLRFFITAQHTQDQIRAAVAKTREELDHLGSSRAIVARPAILQE